MNDAIQDKVAFIIGAGASKEFGLPTGKELSERIVSLLNAREDVFTKNFTDYEFNFAIEAAIRDQMVRGGRQGVHDAAKLLRENLCIAPSIDNFLHTHRTNTDLVWLGKLAIVFCLLRAEESSKLAVDSSNLYNRLDLDKVSETWIGQLFTQLCVAGDFEAFLRRLTKMHFVSFNYDRCIQQFFAFAARQYFNLDELQVNTLISSIRVHYIYGSIGEYRLKSRVESNFGFRPNAQNCLSLVNEIQTFTEGRNAKDRETISNAIDCAREVYFLGFGFNKLNLDRIFPQEGFAAGSVFATTKGMPDIATAQIEGDLRSRFGSFMRGTKEERIRYSSISPTLKNMSCSELIWQCHRNFQDAPD